MTEAEVGHRPSRRAYIEWVAWRDQHDFELIKLRLGRQVLPILVRMKRFVQGRPGNLRNVKKI